MPSNQRMAAPATKRPAPLVPARAPIRPVARAEVRPAVQAQAQGTIGDRTTGTPPRPDLLTGPTVEPAVEPVEPAPGSLAQRQIRRVVLRKLERIVEYHLGDGSVETERVLWYCDFPPGTYTARSHPGTRLGWSVPYELARYVIESGRGYAIGSDTADHARITGTFEGVETFEFQVSGERTVTEDPTGNPDLDAAIYSPELRRYLALRRSAGRQLATPRHPDVDLLPPDELIALLQVHGQLTKLTEADWAQLAKGTGPAPGPTWGETHDRLDRYLRGTRAGIDPDQESDAIARLAGAGRLYDAIARYEHPENTGQPEVDTLVKNEARKEALRELAPAGFDSIEEFDAAVRDLRLTVGRRARLRTLTKLRDSERMLRAELQRYRDPKTLNTLATRLHALAGTDVEALLNEYPILRDPVTYRGATDAMAVKHPVPEFLGELLRQNAQAQLDNVPKSRAALDEDPNLVFSFDIVMGETLAELNIPRDSVHARIIHDGYAAEPHSWLEETLEMVLILLSIAAPMLGALGYGVGLVGTGLQVRATYKRERYEDKLRAAGHAGADIVHPPGPGGGDFLEAAGLAGGLFAPFQVHEIGPPVVPRPAGPRAFGDMGAASIHGESFAPNRYYEEAGGAATRPGARPANGQRALNDSFPIQPAWGSRGAPARRIGVDVDNQQVVVFTRVGDRVEGGVVVGGTYQGRVITRRRLGARMRRPLDEAGIRVERDGRIQVPDTWADLEPHGRYVEPSGQVVPPAAGLPVNGQQALDESVPLAPHPADPTGPPMRLGIDAANQFVEFTTIGVQGTRFRGRVVPVAELTLPMRRALDRAGVRVAADGRVTVPPAWPEIDAATWARHYDEEFLANRHYEEPVGTPDQARPRRGERALDNSVPLGPVPEGKAAPQRIGLDPTSQEFVVLTRVGDRIEEGRVAGGRYSGRVVAEGDLTAEMRAALNDAGLAKDVAGRHEIRSTRYVPGRMASSEPDTPLVDQLRVTDEEKLYTSGEYSGQYEVQVKVHYDSGVDGGLTVRWDPATNTVVNQSADLAARGMPRWVRSGPAAVPGRGTPLATYLRLRAMNRLERLGANFSVPRLVILEEIINLESVAQLALGKLRGMSQAEILPLTHTFQTAENAIIQSGGRVTGWRIVRIRDTRKWGSISKLARDALRDRYPHLNLPAELEVPYLFDVELTVEPAAPPSAESPTGRPPDTR
jgi:hypothetical protein